MHIQYNRPPSSHPGGNWPSTTGRRSGGGRGNPNITSLYGISMLYQNLGVISILNGHKVEQANDKYLADSIRRHSNGGSDIESYKHNFKVYQTMIRERYYLKM